MAVEDRSIVQQIEVFPSLPNGTCYTNIFDLISAPLSISNLQDTITFSGDKISNYGEFRYDTDYVQYYYMEAVPSKATLNVREKSTGNPVGTWNYSLAKNTNYQDRQRFAFAWQATNFGQYTADVTIRGDSALCSKGNSPGMQSIQILTVGVDNDNDHYYSGADCNDNNQNINPGAVEACDSIDNNCNSQTDEGCGCVNGLTRSCSDTKKGICAIVSLPILRGLRQRFDTTNHPAASVACFLAHYY